MIVSIDAEKSFDKIQDPFMITALIKLGIEGKFLNSIKKSTKKSVVNIILMLRN